MADQDIRWMQRCAHFEKALSQLAATVDLSRTRQLTKLEEQGADPGVRVYARACVENTEGLSGIPRRPGPVRLEGHDAGGVPDGADRKRRRVDGHDREPQPDVARL